MEIGAIKTRVPEIKFPQGASPALPPLPLRAIALGGSNSGKTNMVSTLVTDPRFLRGKFEKIYWCSPTALIDDALQPMRDYVNEELDQNQDEDKTFHDHLDVPFLTRVIERARRVMEYLKSRKPRPKRAFNTLIVLDDLGDDSRPEARKLVNTLFMKARHWGVSTILSIQRLRLPLATPTARVNATIVWCWRLKNSTDLLDGLIWEYSALAPKEKIMAAYRTAVDQPYGFLTIRTSEQDPNKMFMNGFKSYFKILDKDDEATSSSSAQARRASQQGTHSAHDQGTQSREDL